MSEAATTRSDHHDTGGRVRILIVEDDESYREALHAGLSMEGYELELAADGTDGLRRFADHPPDLVLLGRDAARAWRAPRCAGACATSPRCR